MKKFWFDNIYLIIVILILLALSLVVGGAMIDRANMPVDHTAHTYILLLTTGEHLTVQFEKCETEIFWSSMYAVCGANTIDGVDETWRAAVVAMEEK